MGIRSWLSFDFVRRQFAFLGVFLVCQALFYCWINPHGFLGLMGAPLCTLWAVLLIICTSLSFYHESRPHKTSQALEWARLATCLVLMTSVLVFFDGSNITNRVRVAKLGDTVDMTLLAMDDKMLGWLFPKGQLALYLDQNTYIGVQSWFGVLCGEVLQLFYVSYYFWGNGLLVYMIWQRFSHTLYYSRKPQVKQRLQWRQLRLCLVAWVGTFLLNFLLNLTFPAISPRLFIEELYKNELRGIFFGDSLRAALKSAASQTYSAFPSGHCGLSIMAAILAYRTGFKRFARCCTVAAVLICSATIVLRYHYFVDFLCAIPMVFIGCVAAGIRTDERFIYLTVSDSSVKALPKFKDEDEHLVKSPSSHKPHHNDDSSHPDECESLTYGDKPIDHNKVKVLGHQLLSQLWTSAPLSASTIDALPQLRRQTQSGTPLGNSPTGYGDEEQLSMTRLDIHDEAALRV